VTVAFGRVNEASASFLLLFGKKFAAPRPDEGICSASVTSFGAANASRVQNAKKSDAMIGDASKEAIWFQNGMELKERSLSV